MQLVLLYTKIRFSALLMRRVVNFITSWINENAQAQFARAWAFMIDYDKI